MSIKQPRIYKIIEALNQHESLSLEDIQQLTGVSIATAYRDIHTMIDAGLAIRVIGGIRKVEISPRAQDIPACNHCSTYVKANASVLIQTSEGNRINACCPHCGLLTIDHFPNCQSALGTDFLYGNMVNLHQATYLLGSNVVLCCAPSLLAFTRIEDAERFQIGFGGDILNFDQAKAKMKELMSPKID